MHIDPCSYAAVSVHEYADGRAVLRYVRLDPGSRRVISEHLLEIDQRPDAPLTLAELLLAGAAERVAQELGDQLGLF